MTRYSPKSTKKSAKKAAAKKKPAAKKKTVVVRKKAKPVLEDLAGMRQIISGLRADNERLSDELSRTRAALAGYTDKIPAHLPALARDNAGLNLTKVIDEGAPKGTTATVTPAGVAPAMDMFAAPPPDKNLTRADTDGIEPVGEKSNGPGDGTVVRSAVVTPAVAAAPEVGPEDPTEEGDDDADDDSDEDDEANSDEDAAVEDMDGPDRSVA